MAQITEQDTVVASDGKLEAPQAAMMAGRKVRDQFTQSISIESLSVWRKSFVTFNYKIEAEI